MSKPMKPKTAGLSAGPTAYWDARSDAAKDAEIKRLREENERLRKALVDIRDSRHCDYDVNGVGSYGIGITHGHRYCSRIASKALEKPESEVRDE